ncbi:FAD-dependent oxidoreductase [Verrucomicrobium sp. BvORR034]|uniref:dihydrolipoyl dehydrogenase family protein n=1 Tax=Verrucomicrobium sp. BvORR034 TaxID=1396418 RepID=UPI00067931D6|nr:FAD-dependent oxidoreductase [Verrucomicrobium sp. BvORR034]
MHPDTDFDFAVLGGGSAGYAAARTAVALGLKTAIIDGAEELGGLCILRGCMPSKTLIESANRNLVIRNAASFGLQATSQGVDTRVIRQRKRHLIADFAGYRQQQINDGRFTVIRGMAQFAESPDDAVNLKVTLKDGQIRRLTAGTALIATGSVINVPSVPGLQETGYWTSDTLLDAEDTPSSFAVLGGGAIALEMAHYLEGIGREVSVIQRSPHLLTGMDTDLAAVVHGAFERRGMGIFCGTRLLRMETAPDGKKRVYFQHAGAEQVSEAAEILVALGRTPATANLEAGNIGIELDRKGQIPVSPEMFTSHPRVFAAGDVTGPLEVVHLAIQQGEVAAKNAASTLKNQPSKHRMDYRCKLFGVFTHPQVAVVGLSETEAREKRVPYLVASYPFNDHGKSMVMDEMEGFVKLLGDPETGEILGGSVVGPEATELIHEIAMAMHLGATAAQVATAPHYHPTLSEIWTYPAEEIAEQMDAKI